MRRDYYLHKRNGIYFVEFVDKVSGKKLPAKSTGETDHLKAKLKAEQWMSSGIPTGRLKKTRPLEDAAGIANISRAIRKAELNADDALRIVSILKSLELIDISAVKNTGRGAVPFVQFLEEFWDYDKSEYIQDKLSHGFRFTRRHAQKSSRILKNVIKPYFNDTKLNAVTTDDLNKLTRQLADKGLSTATIKQNLLVCCTPLKWAYESKIIPDNPCLGLTKFVITYNERGVPTEAEAQAVFAVEWKDKRAFVASLVSCTTGARQGEVLALRKSSIKDDTLNISHSFSEVDGLKCPKNGHKRVAPLLPIVKAALLDLLNNNPHNIDDPFIFYSLLPNKPVSPNVILKGLKDAYNKINVDYKSRRIDFHSWRHFFCSKITQVLDGEKVAKVSGHLSEAVFKKYADHIEVKQIQEVGEAAAETFGKILPFKKAG